MKKTLLALLALIFVHIPVSAQRGHKIEHVIIITTDGLRWQEVFGGMDETLARDTTFNQKDSAGIFKKYWAADVNERRKKLLPFLWDTVGTKGQLYGNRRLNNKVNVANPYWFSFPGYSELFCGFVDTSVNSNAYGQNPNTNLLEFLNKQSKLKGKVAVFAAWSSIENVLGNARPGIPMVCGHEPCGGDKPDREQQLLNRMKKDAYNPFNQWEGLDVFTHYAAVDALEKKKPDVLYISYGETDEWAHEGHYKDYLDAAHTVDKWIADVWSYIQHDDKYRDNTLLFITVDHGRGNGRLWTSHNNKIPGANEIWFGVMGPGIAAKGEVSTDTQLYQKQYAQTIAQLLGYDFRCEHEVAEGFVGMLGK